MASSALLAAPTLIHRPSSFPPPARPPRRSPSTGSTNSTASTLSASSSDHSSSSFHSAASYFAHAPRPSPPLAAAASLANPLEAYAGAGAGRAPLSPPAPQTPRFSRLPFLVAQCIHDAPTARLFFAVRRGRVPGVYADWREAEQQVIPSSPRALREYLAMEFGAATLPSRPRTNHARLATEPATPSFSSLSPSGNAMHTAAPFHDFTPAPRQPLNRASMSYRHSMVRISSPLRQEVDGVTNENAKPAERPRPLRAATTSLYGLGGLLTPPQSPPSALKPAIAPLAEKRPAASPPPVVRPPPKTRSASESDAEPRGLGITGPVLVGGDKRRSIVRSPSSPGLWADASEAAPTASSSGKRASIVAESSSSGFEANASAPKFSRSALRKSAVIMPVAAPRSPPPASPSLRKRASQSTLPLASPSMLSLASTSSASSAAAPAAPAYKRSSSFSLSFRRGDRAGLSSHSSLPSLTSLSEHAGAPSPELAPPRPAFLRSPSTSSLSSTASSQSITSAISVASLTSASSAPSTDIDPIAEERASVDEAAGVAAYPPAGLAISVVAPASLKLGAYYDSRAAAPEPPRRQPLPALHALHGRRESDERSREGSCEGSVDGAGGKKKGAGVFRRFTKALKSKK